MWLSLYSVPSIKERKSGLPTNMKTYLAHAGILVQEEILNAEYSFKIHQIAAD